MGCVHSKKDSADIHPNVFRVVNVDESGAGLWSGQLEITDTELVLYREGRDATVWPLRCLRRYGYDGEIFSFESGRRCLTGEGIYAFRCRRAGPLFRTLQQNIQLRNMASESLPFLSGTLASGSAARSLAGDTAVLRLPTVVAHDIPIDTEVPPPPVAARPALANAVSSPLSPSNNEILEVTSLFPLTTVANSNHITNVYQKQGFRSREYNNNRSESQIEHSYCNDLSRDLAALRMTLKRESALNTIKDLQDEDNFLMGQYMNEGATHHLHQPTSPTISETSEHYARLTEDNGNDRFYMNLTPKNHPLRTRLQNEAASAISFTQSGVPSTSQMIEEINTYANISVGQILEQIQRAQNKLSLVEAHKQSEHELSRSSFPPDEPGVNYAVLDIDNKEDSQHGMPASPDSLSDTRHDVTSVSTASTKLTKLMSQSSVEKASVGPSTSLGYTTIDFDKTIALTSVASGAEDAESLRKIRHNSLHAVSSPNGFDKNKFA